MHRYTSAQARGLRTASPGVEQQQRVALRDRLNQTAASINSLGNSETSVAFYGTQAIPYTTSHRSPAVYVDKFGSPTTISTQPHRQISSSASPWKQTLPSFSGSQFQTASITSAAQTNRGFTITAPSSTATSTRVTSGNLGAATTSAATPYTVQSWRPGANQPSSGASVNSPPSVKHLTCYFWDKYGKCKWADEECLYAHFHTGKVAGGPVQVEIGRPAVAGKNASAPKPVYESWRNHPARPQPTSPVSPLELTQPCNDFTTPSHAPFHTPLTIATQEQHHPALGSSPNNNNPDSSGSQPQQPIGTPRSTPGTGADRDAECSVTAETLYYQQRAQISTLCTAVSLLGACLGSSCESMRRFKDTLSEEGAVLVNVAKEMQGWEGGGVFGGGRDQFAWLAGEGVESGSKSVLKAVQKICDVIDGQKTVGRGMYEAKTRVQGMLGEVGLNGVGNFGGECEGVWDAGSE